MRIPRLLRRRSRTFPGVQFRISTPNGVIVEADSEHLHWIAKYGGLGEPCNPACLPGCQKHGWLDLIAGGGDGMACPAEEFSTVPLKIEIKPVRLANRA